MPETLPQPYHSPETPLAPRGAEAPPLAPAEVAALPEEEGVDFRRYLSVLLRYKWLIALLTVMGAAGGVLAGRFIEPVYVAAATIWIETTPRGGQTSAGPIQPGDLLGGRDWIDLLNSYVVLDDVVRQLRLYLVPGSPQDSLALASFTLKERFVPGSYALAVSADGRGYTLSNQAGVVLETGQVGDSVGRELGFSWVPRRGALPPGRTVRFHLSAPATRPGS